MELMTVLTAVLAISALINVIQATIITKEKRSRAALPPPEKKLEITAQDLLHDLTAKGQAVVRVEVIDMSNLLLRSPRG